MKSHTYTSTHPFSSSARPRPRSSFDARDARHAVSYGYGAISSSFPATPSLPPISPTITTLDALLSEKLPEPNWVIQHIIPEGVTLLVGRSHTGKTWLALSMALAVACGDSVLGTFAARQGDILYLGLDHSERHMHTRARKLLQGRAAPHAFAWAANWNALATAGLADIEEWLEIHPQSRFVVIDTLANVREAAAFSTDAYAVIMPLREMAATYHVAILLLSHLHAYEENEPLHEAGISGSGNIPDSTLLLRRERGEASTTLQVTGQIVDEQKLLLLFDSTTARWTLQSKLH